MSKEVLRLENISKSYSSGDRGKVLILNHLSLTLNEGESIAIVGRSGSGKSTLLNIAALLLKKDEGKIYYSEKDSDSLNKDEIAHLRNEKMGFVFQSSLLLEDFTALENVAFPLLIRGKSKKDAYKEAEEYLSLVEMREEKNHRPRELSGGEKQRVAIARALSGNGDIIFADEPTGSLDEKSSEIIENLLFNAVKEKKKSMILVTHNTLLASHSDKVLTLKGGDLSEE